jgi:DNA-binding response OmpR family regulator
MLAVSDPVLASATCSAFQIEGFEVIAASDGLQALRCCRSARPDLAVVHATLTRLDGYALCRALRLRSATPVVMLVARPDDDQVVPGFQAGADDCVAANVSVAQLVARVRAVLRRAMRQTDRRSDDLIRTSTLRLDPASHEVTRRAATVRLSPIEFRILYMLAVNEGRLVSPRRLVEYVWGYDDGTASALKTHVSHIRSKLGMGPGDPDCLRAVSGVGYTLPRPFGASAATDAPTRSRPSPAA